MQAWKVTCGGLSSVTTENSIDMKLFAWQPQIANLCLCRDTPFKINLKTKPSLSADSLSRYKIVSIL